MLLKLFEWTQLIEGFAKLIIESELMHWKNNCFDWRKKINFKRQIEYWGSKKLINISLINKGESDQASWVLSLRSEYWGGLLKSQ